MFEKVVVIDCKNHLLGRLASIVAKELLAGQRVVARGVMGEVDEFDEESGTYEVRETRSRRLLTYVEEGEVREVRD